MPDKITEKMTEKITDNKTRVKMAMKVSVISIIGNLLLSVFKLIAGIVAHSGAMISDAIHSASDLLSTFVVMIGINVSSKGADESHPYGHERLESVAAVALAVILIITGAAIGYNAVLKIAQSSTVPLQTPGIPALVAAVVSIIVKEVMYRITVKTAKRIDSDALIADAWHHRSDALSSVGSLAGIAGARLGLPVLDPIAAIVICLMILKVAFTIIRDALSKLTDRACSAEINAAIECFILEQDGVQRIDVLRTRTFASRFYVEVEIAVDGALSLYDAHEIADNVCKGIEGNFPAAKQCMVHVNPLMRQDDDMPRTI